MIPKRINITCPPTYLNKVIVIRCIRTLSRLGLKEAKDVCEDTTPQKLNIDRGVSMSVFEEQCRLMQNEGIIIRDLVNDILDELRELGSQALSLGEDELASEIVQLVLAEKIRRSG